MSNLQKFLSLPCKKQSNDCTLQDILQLYGDYVKHPQKYPNEYEYTCHHHRFYNWGAMYQTVENQFKDEEEPLLFSNFPDIFNISINNEYLNIEFTRQEDQEAPYSFGKLLIAYQQILMHPHRVLDKSHIYPFHRKLDITYTHVRYWLLSKQHISDSLIAEVLDIHASDKTLQFDDFLHKFNFELLY